MKKILFPQDWGNLPTLYDMWYNVTKGEISPLGSGSDYASFYQNGIGCVSALSHISSCLIPVCGE
jgi:N-acetylated-alpha-linked acidic dipeptidase